ncbi:MAG: hypothetical protein KJ666_16830 [Bacteroidetes bacterium]|nr:hypothetical protein [Bacteroidota bacterium]MBU2584435.1 hypothetical protein [Bacteroidota bacterium]
MEKVAKIVSRKESQNDFSFWMSRTPQERISAIEILRQQYLQLKKDAQPRLQRVYTITKRKPD